MTVKILKKNKGVIIKTIVLFSVLSLIACAFLYGYDFESEGWKRFTLLCMIASGAGLVSLFFELYSK